MQDTKTIKNVKPTVKKQNIFSYAFQKGRDIIEKAKKENETRQLKNLGNSKKCECGRYYGLDGGTMRKSKTRKSGYICQVCFEKEQKGE